MKFTSISTYVQILGYGCMTCIGNSGSLAEPIVETMTR